MTEESMKRFIFHLGFDWYWALNEAKSHPEENDALGEKFLKGHIEFISLYGMECMEWWDGINFLLSSLYGAVLQIYE